MKILYICPDYGIPVLGKKGAAVHVREMSNAFIRAGHSLVIAAPSATRSPWEEAQHVDAEFIQFPMRENASEVIRAIKSYTNTLNSAPSLAGEIRRIIYNEEFETRLFRRFKNSPPDFIYVRASLYSTTGVELKESFNIPLVVEINAPLAMEQNIYRSSETSELAYAAEYKLLFNADAVLCVSQELKNYVISLGIDDSLVHVIPNGVNPEYFNNKNGNPGLKKKLGIRQGPVLGFVGGLRPWHGVDILPSLLSNIRDKYLHVQLLIVGEGPLRTNLENQFREKNLENNVVFSGTFPHRDIADIIKLFDIALAPYAQIKHEFYFSPLKLFEYMACAVPIVTTRIGQIKNIIQDNETGLLYEPDDIEGLTRHCFNILENPDKARLLGVNAANVVKEKHTWDHSVKRVLDIVGEL